MNALPPEAIASGIAPAIPPEGSVYRPSPEDAKLIADTQEKYRSWAEDRKPHEAQWFINNAFFRNQQDVEIAAETRAVRNREAAPKRVRLKLNRLQAKVRARIAKFLKNRPKPIVIPATTEYEDYLKARGSQRMLDYQWRKLGLEQKFKNSLYSAKDCGKAFWWFHWDADKKARIMQRDPMTGRATYTEAVVGDIVVENDDAFGTLVADPFVERIADQPEIMRITSELVSDMQRRYPEIAPYIVADTSEDTLFLYQRQMAALSPLGVTGNTADKKKKDRKYCTVKQHFIRPNGQYPQGHYRVLVGQVLAKAEDELPFGFADMENPFPCVEFADMTVNGTFWVPTMTEFLIDVQREYNLLRSKAAEHARWMAYPKMIAARQHQLPKGAWTADPGEFIEYAAYPNIPPPTVVAPAGVNNDIWRLIEIVKQEFDDISQIFPVSEGKSGGTNSGFQANLLQEASDTVHGPDLRQHELSLEDAYRKIRRLTRFGYTVPRLLAAASPGYTAEIFEFSGEMVDEYADIVVEIGSGLPLFKAARQETVMQLYNSGMMGDIADPAVRRRALGLLEMGSLEEAMDGAKTDESRARWENIQMASGQQPRDPEPWEDHDMHYSSHTMWLKSPEGNSAPPDIRMLVIRHAVLHGRYINPQSALQIAQDVGLQDPLVYQKILALLPPPVATATPGAPPADPNAAPPQTEPPAPAPAEPAPAPTRVIRPA